MFYLSNRKDLMGEHKNTIVVNVILVAILLFSLVTSFIGVRGVWQLLTT